MNTKFNALKINSLTVVGLALISSTALAALPEHNAPNRLASDHSSKDHSVRPGDMVSTTLELNPTMLDWAGERALDAMYMPSSAVLSPTKPSEVTKEPTYASPPLYGEIKLGNGPKSVHAFAVDAPQGAPAKIYIDTEGNGDLTSGGDGSWDKSMVNSGITNYRSTVKFRVSYGNPSKESGFHTYGLNLYWADGRSAVYYYRAGVLTGQIALNGEKYKVTVIDQNNQALYNLPFKIDDKPTRPVQLFLDGARFDARGTFSVGGMNYIAMLSPDGTRLSLKATSKSILPPKPAVATTTPKAIAAGVEAPDFTVPGADGSNVQLSSLRGKIVILDFWATWCGPCKASLPHIEKIWEKYKDKNVQVLALNVFDDKGAYDEWIPANKQYTFPFAYDPAGRAPTSIAGSKYLVTGIPTTFVIDPSGKIATVVVGFGGLDDHRIEDALAKLGVPTSN